MLVNAFAISSMPTQSIWLTISCRCDVRVHAKFYWDIQCASAFEILKFWIFEFFVFIYEWMAGACVCCCCCCCCCQHRQIWTFFCCLSWLLDCVSSHLSTKRRHYINERLIRMEAFCIFGGQFYGLIRNRVQDETPKKRRIFNECHFALFHFRRTWGFLCVTTRMVLSAR